MAAKYTTIHSNSIPKGARQAGPHIKNRCALGYSFKIRCKHSTDAGSWSWRWWRGSIFKESQHSRPVFLKFYLLLHKNRSQRSLGCDVMQYWCTYRSWDLLAGPAPQWGATAVDPTSIKCTYMVIYLSYHDVDDVICMDNTLLTHQSTVGKMPTFWLIRNLQFRRQVSMLKKLNCYSF